MKKIMIGLATAGLLLGTGAAFSQNTQSGPTTSPGTTQSQPAPGGSQSAPSGGREGGAATQSGGERRDGNRSERSGDRGGDRSSGTTVRGGEREGMRGRERGERSVNVQIRRGGDGYRHRRGHRMDVYASGCRTIIIKKRHHGETVIKRIRRCG
jgi:hypothetical protein